MEEEPRILNSKVIDEKREGKKDKKNFIILAVLIPVLLYLAFTTFFKGHKKAATPALPALAAAPLSEPSALTLTQAKTVTPEALQAEGEWGFNPFAPHQTGEGKGATTLQLQGIAAKGKGGDYALINNQIVKAGDRIAVYTVVTIETNKVVLKSDRGDELVLAA